MPILSDHRQPESSSPPPVSVPPSAPVANWQTYRRLWVFIRPYSRPLTLVVFISLGATALTLFSPTFPSC